MTTSDQQRVNKSHIYHENSTTDMLRIKFNIISRAMLSIQHAVDETVTVAIALIFPKSADN